MMANIYLDRLQLFVFRQFDGIEHEEGENVFQQHGCPPHLSHEVLSALNIRLPNWWTGRGGPTPGPNDLSPLDFLLWGFIKKNSFTKIQYLHHL
jgi:hypothetical protein